MAIAIPLNPCAHPAQIRDKDGALRCLACGAVIRPTQEPEPEKPPAKRTAKKGKAPDA